MQDNSDYLVGRMPNFIVHAIQHGRKIEAIKHVRQHYQVGLKQAKQIVEEYIAENGGAENEQPETAGLTIERVILLLIVAAIIYGLYDYLAK